MPQQKSAKKLRRIRDAEERRHRRDARKLRMVTSWTCKHGDEWLLDAPPAVPSNEGE